MKCIDLNKNIKTLVSEYPEIIDIMVACGFTDIKNPMMLNTVGRFMTIPKGAKIRNLSLEKIKEVLTQHGFTIKE
ncbi:MAG TPA: DUF1858 domain-containing protein [Haloplasmataceae bacterium]